MSTNSNIEWTTHTFNPWRGCTKVSPGCAHCYAETLSKRNPAVLGVWGDNGSRSIAAESYWRLPLAWDRAAAAVGERHRVFCASLADWLERRPELIEPRRRLLRVIEVTPHLDWLLLSKRIDGWRERIAEVSTERHDLANWWLDGDAPANVWLGTSVENQQTADERIPHLLKCPARVRFLSVEPLLGPIDLRNVNLGVGENIDIADGDSQRFTFDALNGTACGSRIDWVIVGGESGPHARPMHPEWARSLRDQCEGAGVAFFFKQWGDAVPIQRIHGGPGVGDNSVVNGKPVRPGLRFEIIQPDDACMIRVGKKAAGRLLDGREWSEFPATSDETCRKVNP